MDNGRAQKLTKHLHAIVHGRTSINADNSHEFTEGICSQKNRADCVSKLIASKAGLDALRSSMQYQPDAEFFNGDASKLLRYLQDLDIKDLSGGSLLYQVVTRIIDPPIFWDAFLDHFGRGLLSIEAQRNFAWLLHFLVAYPAAPPIYCQQASDIVGTLVSSFDSAVSALGANIKQITDACGPIAQPLLPSVPDHGGRHDNDFADFCKVSIAPSAEEIDSTQRPYLCRHLEVEDTPHETRIATHLDNQFRLRCPISPSPHLPRSLLEQLEHHAHHDLKNLLNTSKTITLDAFQSALISGLTSGAGKSLIGALFAKALHKSTKVRILVVCYTNYALDDTLTSFLDTSIPDTSIVRLGGKSIQKTDSFRMNKHTWAVIDYLEHTQSVCRDDSQRQFLQHLNANVTLKDILEHIEFEGLAFFKAFCVPVQGDGLQRVEKKGKALDELYLIRQWVKGRHAGVLKNESNAQNARDIWNMQPVVSLTRSDAQNDIGFMNSPERENVLLPRARNALIMIGNTNTFSNSRKGSDLWKNVFSLLKNMFSLLKIVLIFLKIVFSLLKKGSHVFDGLLIQCQRHSDRISLLKSSDDFEANCSEGGCIEPCGVLLRCGLHKCPSKCDQIHDHSKMKCIGVMRSTCSNGHEQTWECHRDQPLICTQCERQTKLDEELQQQREAEERQHQEKIDGPNARIAEQEQVAKDPRLAHERGNGLDQREEDLKAPRDVVSGMPNEPTHQANTARSFAGPTLDDASATTNQPTEHSGSNQNPTDEMSNSGIDQNINSTQPASPSSVPDPISGKPIPPVLPTPSEIEWERQKTLFGANNTAIDAIMALTGLESVKESVLTLKDTIDTTIRQGVPSNYLRLNVAFLGNPGTGKTTIAREYAKFLASIQALPADCFKETTGSKLANDGVKGAQQLLEEIADAGGGTLFIDEAYQLTADHNYGGKNVLDFLLAEMENNTGKIAFIVAGHNKEMERFFEHNPGLQSRVPNKFLFEDYSDSELLSMFQNLIKKRYGGRMMIEGGHDGLYVRIAIRRLGRGRGRPGFGNARDLQNMLNKVASFQAKRLRQERGKHLNPNDFLITGEDLIGLRPSDVLKTSSAWAELHKMIGIQSVKDSVLNLTDIVEKNYDRELQEKEPLQLALNRIFLGSPGTGKTAVASLYGQILVELMLISNGEVVIKNPSDFIGAALGESEKKTKGILATTIGKVLVIDEAYMLYGGRGEGSHINDPYKTAVIDTIVAEAHNKPGEDRCILMLGYKDKMIDMFQNVNQGLSRRFAVDDPMIFEDFDNSQLLDILNRKLKNQDITATDAAKAIAIQLLDRSRNRPNFGNAGEVENLLSAAKQRYQGRIRLQKLPSSDVVLEPQDFDPDFDRGVRSSDNLKKLFEDTVGFEYLVEKLENYQNIVKVAKQRGLKFQDYIPFNFIFKGPPGTGKTTVARKMGKVYYDIGILATTEVVECSATDLVGQHVGQTGPKTMKLLEKALGKVLFIDEAYRLSEGHFAQEAIDELVGLLTQEKFKAKLIVILAGYDQDMNHLLAVNAGLASRFPEQIFFINMTPNHCIELLRKQLAENKVLLHGIDTPNSEMYRRFTSAFIRLSKLPSWGNARDVLTLARRMVAAALLSTPANNTGPINLPSAKALSCVNDMLTEQLERCSNTPSNGSRHHHSHNLPMQTDTMRSPPPSAINMNSSFVEEQYEDEEELVEASDSDNNGRDPGVSDEIWLKLQEAKLAKEQRQKREEEKAAKLHKEATDKKEVARRQEREVQGIEAAMKRSQDEQKRLEMLKKLEVERLKAADARRRAAEAEQKRKLEEQRREEERKKEAKKQEALRLMGVCVAGYQWYKVSGGYRCEGGSHYVSDSRLPS